VASKLVERETLNEPSLEKAASDYQSDVGNVNWLRAPPPCQSKSPTS
jgi:hypothetical protein